MNLYFKSFNEFIHMGGYAHYVWSAYAMVALVLIFNFIIPLWEKNKLLNDLQDETTP